MRSSVEPVFIQAMSTLGLSGQRQAMEDVHTGPQVLAGAFVDKQLYLEEARGHQVQHDKRQDWFK